MHSHEEASDYELKVSTLKADFQNSFFLKMGFPETIVLPAGSTGVYKFIIDEKSEV